MSRALVALTVLALALIGTGCTPEPTRRAPLNEDQARKSSVGAMTPELRAAYIRSVQANASEEHRVKRTAAGTLKATSPSQRLTATFLVDGVALESTEGGASLGSIALGSYGCPGDLVKVSRAEPIFEGNRVEYRRAELVEWYVNGPLGIEQGFRILAPPGCRDAKGALLLELELGGGLSAELREPAGSDPGAARGSEIALHAAGASEPLRYSDLFVSDASGRQVPAWLTISKERPAIHVNDAGAVYPLEIDPMISVPEQLSATDGNTNDNFGFKIAIDGDTAIVGAQLEDGTFTDQGAAYVFVRGPNGGWSQQQKLTAGIDAELEAQFGSAVAIHGNRALIGAPGDDEPGADCGAAYVFIRSGGTWIKTAKLLAADKTAGNYFGVAVAIFEDTAFVGSPGADTGMVYETGAAYVFVLSNVTGEWTQQHKLTPNTLALGDYFGISVALFGDTALIGANAAYDPSPTDKGSAYIYTRSSGSWTSTPPQKLTQSDSANFDLFGASVALSGSTALVGAPGKPAAYVFKESGGTWTQQKKLTPSILSADQFGTSVAIDGNIAVIGSSEDDEKGAESGAAYVFAESGGVWTQKHKLLASTGAAGDRFGTSVAISKTDVVVGAPKRDLTFLDQGSAYVFRLAGEACSVDSNCALGFCVDGFCCDSACGGNDASDCQACSITAGAASNGVCALREAGALCRASTGTCDAQETCTGASAACPTDAPAADGTACNDSDQCTQIDTCQSGVCVGTSPVQCFALDQCHVVGACDPASGVCSNPAKQGNPGCNDGNVCTTNDTCQSGICVGSNPLKCVADNDCNDTACHPQSGCLQIPKAPNTACNDGNQCTQIDTCNGAGVCVGTSPVVCVVAPDECHDPGTCNPVTGVCIPKPKPGVFCDDNNACTQTDTCNNAGVCVGSNPMPCPADDCNDAVCDPQDGTCVPKPKVDETACDDDDQCTKIDKCNSGKCVGTSLVQCSALDLCHEPGICDPATGACSNPAKADGTPCKDTNECTLNDSCQAGICTGDAIVCPDLDACHGPGECNKATGKCSYAEKPNCSLSDAGLPPPPPLSLFQACKKPEECASGFCKDGVCCNEACDGVCYTCVQPYAIGTCLPAPPGSDLRGDCGKPGECGLTCSGVKTEAEIPECIPATALTECLPSECLDDGINGLATAVCRYLDGPDLKCDLNDRSTFQCTHNRCIKQTGQCGEKCASSDDCVPPFVCNPESQCVPPPPIASGEPSSCAAAPGSSSGAFGLASLIAALASSFLRRRRPSAARAEAGGEPLRRSRRRAAP